MGASAQLSTTELAVEPGRSATATLTIRNNGSVVDRFSFEGVGAAARWITFTPDTLSLFPQASGDVTINFAPPRDPTVAAGSTPFGVRVMSSEDPSETVVEEGTVDVGSYSDVGAELLPRVTRGRRWARAQVAIDNRSNCVYRAQLEGRDPSQALLIALNPVTVDVPPGAAAFVRVRIKPKTTFWRGPATNKPYAVLLRSRAEGEPAPASQAGAGAAPAAADAPAASTGAPPAPPAGAAAVAGPHKAEIVADGSMLQESLIASWVFKAIAALVALAILFVILWFALFRPQIKSLAQSQVKDQLAKSGVPSNGSGGGGSTGSGGGGSGGGGTSGGTSNVTTAPSTGGSGGSGSSPGAPSSSINGTGTANGNGTTVIYTVPSGKELDITDLLVENSAGDSGVITLERNGNVLMSWALANFRDLDYHWIVPTVFVAGNKVQMNVSGCSGACHPGIYYAGNLVKS